MRETDKLDGVEALVVPVPPAAAPSAHTVYYTTRRGDTLVSVADRFGVSLSQLRRWNKLRATGIKVDAGRRLHVAEPTLGRGAAGGSHGASAAKSTRSREVASTVRTIAREHKLSPRLLKARHTQQRTAKKSASSSAHRSQLAQAFVALQIFLANAKVSGSPLLHTCVLIAFTCKVLLEWLRMRR